MASPFPFTSGQVLTAAQLNSIGEATAFTPSWTNFTPGNAVESWHYVQVNEWLYFSGQTVLGSTSSVTGFMEIDFPVGTQLGENGVVVGTALYFDVGSFVRRAGVLDQSGDDIRFFYYSVVGSLIGVATTSATAPFTFATTDIIQASGAVLLA